MSLRLAVDLDGVLADMHGELARQGEHLFGETLSRRRLAQAASSTAADEAEDQTTAEEETLSLDRLPLTIREQRRLWRHVEAIENFWETLQEIEPGSVRQLWSLAAERRWEIVFLTTRPRSAGLTTQLQTQRWLASKGFPLPSVYVVKGSRGRVAAALDLDFVVDDRPDNCLDVVVDSGAKAMLVWREDERRLPPEARRVGIGVVHSFAECLDILQEVDASTADGGSFVERVKRLLTRA